MDEKTFDDPRLALNRIYTKRGDAGQTSLAGGQRVAKDSLRIEGYGNLGAHLAHVSPLMPTFNVA